MSDEHGIQCRCDTEGPHAYDGWYIAHDNELRECPAPIHTVPRKP